MIAGRLQRVSDEHVRKPKKDERRARAPCRTVGPVAQEPRKTVKIHPQAKVPPAIWVIGALNIFAASGYIEVVMTFFAFLLIASCW